MRKFLLFLFMIAPLLAQAASTTVQLDVQGMTCGLCTVTVRKALQKVPGVKSVKVALEQSTATVVYDPAKTAPEDLVLATGDAGYRATVRPQSPSATPAAQ